jgi:hypothetical protein
MKAAMPQRFDTPYGRSSAPRHASYLAHRKQVVWQVYFPVVLAALLLAGLIVLISLSTFRGEGDVGRWAAISTIWIVIPVLVVGLIFLIALVGVNYLVARLARITPVYTGLAQDYAYRGAAVVKRITAAVVKPVMFLDGLAARLKEFFRRG